LIGEEVELKDTITKAENGGMRLMLSRVMKQLHRSKKPSERLSSYLLAVCFITELHRPSLTSLFSKAMVDFPVHPIHNHRF
jgi:hypothetical protein